MGNHRLPALGEVIGPWVGKPPLRGNDFFTMKSALRKRCWALDHKRSPAKTYVETLPEVVEQCECRAAPLGEVVRMEEAEPNVLIAL